VRLGQRQDQRRRIFSKKLSFEDKEVLGEKKPAKLMKKFSDTFELERA
jgi:hypothetical protein